MICLSQKAQVTSSVAIIGAGPAGLSCALWLINQGYHPIVLERAAQPCGMLRFNYHTNDWLLGFPGGTGHSIGEKFLEHVQHKKINIITSALLASISREESGFVVNFSGQMRHNPISAAYLVIASGTRPRAPIGLIRLASQFPDNFFIGAGELRVSSFTAGQHVAVLGGGDNAFENACHLAQHGVKVSVYYRAKARARSEWVTRCREAQNISIHPQATVGQFVVSGKQVCFLANNELQKVDAVAVMYGYEPNTDTLREIAPWLDAAIDEKGFIKVNSYQQTPIGRLYAIGDVTDRPFHCLPSAIGQGSTAAKAIALEDEGMLP